MDAWPITWMQPDGSEFVHWISREIGDRIVQEGVGSDPRRRERWNFTDITVDSFVWPGKVSFDHCVCWSRSQEMRAVRIKAVSISPNQSLKKTKVKSQ